MDIQKAITEIRESGLYGNQVHQETLELALAALQEHVEREEGCNGCAHNGLYENEIEYGYPSPCTDCQRRAVDNYVHEQEGF